MAQTRIIGDIHGKWQEYALLTAGVERSVQVGDFGVGFAGPYWHERANDRHADGRHRFIRGNHDDPEKCKTEMVGYIPDGTVEKDVMFVGGAWSIDADARTEGVSWWRDEELSMEEFYRIIETYSVVRPRVMITHDCPTTVSKVMFHDKKLSLSGQHYQTRTGAALQAMFEIHQPELHIFGHWHHTKTEMIEGTKFMCLGELDFVDIDLYSVN